MGIAGLHMVQNKVADGDLSVDLAYLLNVGRIGKEPGVLSLGDLLHGLVMGRGRIDQPPAGIVPDGLAHCLVQFRNRGQRNGKVDGVDLFPVAAPESLVE